MVGTNAPMTYGKPVLAVLTTAPALVSNGVTQCGAILSGFVPAYTSEANAPARPLLFVKLGGL